MATTLELAEDIEAIKGQLSKLEIRTDQLNAFAACVDEIFKCGQYNYLGKFAFIADAGEVNAVQAQIGALITADDPVALFAGGDNNYPSGAEATIEANWAAFATLVTDEKVFPALGNHDLDTLNGQPQLDKFDYLPGNKRYYSVLFEDQNLELFVLNSGFNTAGTIVELDGNRAGGDNTGQQVQWEWFVDAVADSQAKWKVAMFHHPAITLGTRSLPKGQLHWPFASLGIDLVLQGHQHINEHIWVKENTGKGCHYVQCSSKDGGGTYAATVQHAIDDDAVGHITDFAEYNEVWRNGPAGAGDNPDDNGGYWRISVYVGKLKLEFVNNLGYVKYSFNIVK